MSNIRERPLTSRGPARGARYALRALVPLLLASACAREAEPRRATDAAADEPPLAAASAPYRVVPVDSGGRVRGTVEIVGEAPRDTLVRPTADRRVCGDSLVDLTVDRDGPRLGGVVVWLEGVRRGKPLPLERRYALTNERCRLEPRVQAAIAGGTLNLRSSDPLVHRTRLVRTATGETVALIGHNDAGQVVPNDEVLDAPGRIRASSDVHPWTRAWILVFDHPYFAVTGRDGTFAIDSVPAGRYRLLAWHERFGLLEDNVAVAPAAEARAALRFGR